MLIVISNPVCIANEAAIINTLFDEGLEILHFRKPNISIVELRAILDAIHSKYRHQIVIHQHHELAIDTGIRRLHFSETNRKETSDCKLVALKESSYTLSTSIHDVKAYSSLQSSFDYAFFGPVFNSISKQGYMSILADGFIFPIQENKPKVIAIGGINAANINMVKVMQFQGAAVLGTIWQHSINNSIHQFKTMQKVWK